MVAYYNLDGQKYIPKSRGDEGGEEERMLSVESNIASLDEGKADYTRIDECNDIVSFQIDAKGVPLKSLTATINPKQSGSGDPSPDNVRPISGWESVDVSVAGKNLLKNTVSSSSAAGVTYTVNDDKTISLSGTATSNMFIVLSDPYYLSSGNYTMKKSGNANVQMLLRVRTAAGSSKFYATTHDRTSVIDGGTYVGVIRVASGTNTDGITLYPQLELGTTATDYEPYQADTYTTDLPETVYGGSLDVVNGVLTVDRVKATYDGSADESWAKYGTGTRFTVSVPDYTSPITSTVDDKLIANYLQTIAKSGQGVATGVISGSDTGYHAIMVNVGIEDLADMRSYLAENPLEVVYPLATPTTIQLTPKQVTTLLGTNNVWADSGEVCLEYEHTQGVPTLKARRTTYTTTESSEGTFALTDYTASDILFVYVNGLMLVEGDEYTIVGTNVVLTTPITQTGTTVHIVALQAR